MALRGLRVIEIAGLAPVPFCGMVLADFGAEVIRVDRVEGGRRDFLSRGKKSIQLDLKRAEARTVLLELVQRADVLLDPFRPGVLEKLGLGPEECFKRNNKLVFARISGFGQTGAQAKMAGHDINYLSMSGALHAFGRHTERPHFPQNLLADMAGGGLMCAFGIVAALLERQRSGLGQVIDVSMTDSVSYLASMSYVARNFLYSQPVGTNMLDGGAHFYDTYRCSDGKFMAVGAIEPQFYSALLQGLRIPSDHELWSNQMDASKWPEYKKYLQSVFLSKTQAEWAKIFAGTDACATPVLEWDALDERVLVDVADEKQIAPAPLLSRTPAHAGPSEPEVGQHTRQVLEGWLSEKQIAALAEKGAIAGASILKAKL